MQNGKLDARKLGLALCVVALFVIGCAEEEGRPCIEGAEVACVCETGRPGTQTCVDAAGEYSDCVCWFGPTVDEESENVHANSKFGVDPGLAGADNLSASIMTSVKVADPDTEWDTGLCPIPNMALPGCTECEPAYTGDNCDECSNGNKHLADCVRCKAPFIGLDTFEVPCDRGYDCACDLCKIDNKALPECVECKPEFAGDDCDECSNANTLLPECTDCKAAFTGDDCDECVNPNRATPDCEECKPEFTGPNCNECADESKSLPDCE